MPTYKYKCSNDVEHAHTEVRSINAPEPESSICIVEGCGGTMDRVFEAPNIEFKGGGWSTKETWR
jgi:predicted nucleic acid-binding Zn ribbon protein